MARREPVDGRRHRDGRDDLVLQLPADQKVAVLPGTAVHLGSGSLSTGAVEVSSGADTVTHVDSALTIEGVHQHRVVPGRRTVEPTEVTACCGPG